MINGIIRDKKFLKTIVMLAIPITMQSFVTSSLNLVDNVMVGKLGEEAIASVGLANQYIFIFTLCIIGINAGASIFMSQFWGKKDISNVKTTLGLDIILSVLTAMIFMLGALIFPVQIMNILSKDIQVINMGANYLRIVAISCLFTSFTQGFSSALRSTEQPKVPMYASIIGVLINAFLNWILIFGKFGFPAMGVNGAALATIIARLIEMIFIVLYIYINKNTIEIKIKELFCLNIEFIKIYFKTSWSVILNELMWALGMTAYSIAYAQIGTSAVATMQISTTLNNMFMVFLIGLANAASIIIGNKIGADEEDLANRYSTNIAVISVIVGFVIGLIVWVTSPLIINLFNVTMETYNDTLQVLRIMALFFTLRSFNMVMIVGVFRGGGDTTYAMLLQSCTIWMYSVPIAFIGAILIRLPVYGVFFLICTEEIIKCFFQVYRLRTGKWLKNVIADIENKNINEEFSV